jgi:hypothetical protein
LIIHAKDDHIVKHVYVREEAGRMEREGGREGGREGEREGGRETEGEGKEEEKSENTHSNQQRRRTFCLEPKSEKKTPEL